MCEFPTACHWINQSGSKRFLEGAVVGPNRMVDMTLGPNTLDLTVYRSPKTL